MSLQNTEELYSFAKWTPKAGEEDKKCASSPAWLDRALNIQVFCCLWYSLAKRSPGQLRHSRTTLSTGTLGVREAEFMHKRKWSVLGKCPLSEILVPAHALVHARGEGNAVAEIRNLQCRKFQLTAKCILWYQMAHLRILHYCKYFI